MSLNSSRASNTEEERGLPLAEEEKRFFAHNSAESTVEAELHPFLVSVWEIVHIALDIRGRAHLRESVLTPVLLKSTPTQIRRFMHQ